LIDRVAANRVRHIVEFDDQYRDVESLNWLIRSADVVLVPYQTRDQVTSGVLIEAIASGKPVIATDFPHSRELLGSGAGIVVAHDSPGEIARAVELVLRDHRLARMMATEAARLATPMMWPVVGRDYLGLVEAVCARVRARRQLPMRVA
jgi:polysaccharide biosynthesis protein PslF